MLLYNKSQHQPGHLTLNSILLILHNIWLIAAFDSFGIDAFLLAQVPSVACCYLGWVSPGLRYFPYKSSI